jgi:AcrR family transcriptional regulator
MSATTVEPGLRERKKERTRVAIEKAALKLFKKKGIEATTVEEIAAAADVSPRTFFRYFATKEDVLFGGEDDGRWFKEQLEHSAPGDSVLDVLRAGFIAWAEDFEVNRERHLVRFRLSRTSPSLALRIADRRRRHEELVVQALATGAEHELEVRMEVAAAFAALRVCIDRWLEQGGTGDLAAMALDVLDRLGRGFSR